MSVVTWTLSWTWTLPCIDHVQVHAQDRLCQTNTIFNRPDVAGAVPVKPLEDDCQPPGRVVLLLSISAIPVRFSLQRATEVLGMHLDMV